MCVIDKSDEVVVVESVVVLSPCVIFVEPTAKAHSLES